MEASTRDRISVDLHGLKAALLARAQAERLDLSALVRRAIKRELDLGASTTEAAREPRTGTAAGATVRLSFRLTSAEAAPLVASARRAGLSRGAYVAGLLAEVPLLAGGAEARPDILAALNASCAELSTLSRDLRHLSSLLRQGQVRAAQEYRHRLDTLGADVRAHLEIAAPALAQLRPFRGGPGADAAQRHQPPTA